MDNENIIGKGGFGTVYPAYEKGDYLKKTKYFIQMIYAEQISNKLLIFL